MHFRCHGVTKREFRWHKRRSFPIPLTDPIPPEVVRTRACWASGLATLCCIFLCNYIVFAVLSRWSQAENTMCGLLLRTIRKSNAATDCLMFFSWSLPRGRSKHNHHIIICHCTATAESHIYYNQTFTGSLTPYRKHPSYFQLTSRTSKSWQCNDTL